MDGERVLDGPDALDFWLGGWACSWEGGHGRNRISRGFDGRIVLERFQSEAPERWSGMSVSVHHERHGWRQTWVDPTGNYWALEGGPHPEGFAFVTTDDEDGRRVMKRMVFSDIELDAFGWRWERSMDEGATWEGLWTIAYRREARMRHEGQRSGSGPQGSASGP